MLHPEEKESAMTQAYSASVAPVRMTEAAASGCARAAEAVRVSKTAEAAGVAV